MANKSTTSDDEKTAHQQRTSVDDDLCGDLRFRKPLETPTAADGSSAEPVKARIAADGGASIVDAMSYAEDVTALSRGPVADVEDAYVIALAAEVRRLREESESYRKAAQDAYDAGLSATKKLREERDLFAEAGRAAELRIVELREQVALMGAALKQQDEAARVLRVATEAAASKLSGKLARVEALPAKFDEHATVAEKSIKPSWAVPFTTCARELRDALRDEPQPEREPKLPYNGY